MTESQTINSLVQSIELVERYFKCILSDPDASDKSANKSELGSFILHFSQAIKTHKFREKTFEEFVEMIDSSSEETDWESVLSSFTEKLNSYDCSNKSPEQCTYYQNFLKLVPEITSNNDDEIETISQNINLVDPISKLPIVEPVKNKKCGHVYEKNTILQFLSKNSKMKCPIAGCSASDFVKKSDLISDNMLKRIVSNASSENIQKKKLKLMTDFV